MYYCDVEGDCPQADGDEPAGDWATSHDSVYGVLVNKKSNTMLMFILFSTENKNKKKLVSFLCCCFAYVFPSHFQSPWTFYLYLSISCVSSWSFPLALSVLVFHVPMVMLSLPQILHDAPVAYLTPPSWCMPEGIVLVDPGGDRSGMVW